MVNGLSIILIDLSISLYLEPVPGSCGSNQFRCASQACINQDRVCDFSDDCGDYSDEALSVCGKFVSYQIKHLHSSLQISTFL